MKKKITNAPTIEHTENFEMLSPILDSVYDEIKELSKKKQDETLNANKVRQINRVLEKVKLIMQNDPTSEFLDLLDDSSLPSNSDAVLIIAQYRASMKQFRDKHYTREHGVWEWRTSD